MVLASCLQVHASITVLHYWRMGENDPGGLQGSSCVSTLDALGNLTITNAYTVIGPSTFYPLYENIVSAVASNKVGSQLGVSFGSGYGGAPVISNLTDNFGIEFWVNPVNGGNGVVVYNGNTGASGCGVYQSGSNFQMLFGGVNFAGSASVPANTWSHVALVRNNGTATLYVNGVATGPNSTLVPNPPVGSFLVGANNSGGERFGGQLDELRVFTFQPGQFSTNDLLLNTTYPLATTLPATSVSNTVATLTGIAAPFTPGLAWFEWGWRQVQRTAATPVAGYSSITANLSGLTAGLIYHGRLVVSNAFGVIRGRDVAFGAPQILAPANVTVEVHSVFVNPATVLCEPLAIEAGANAILALKGDGTVVGWGDNFYGQTTIPAGLSNVVAVAGSPRHSLALKVDGTVVAWGDDSSGQTNVPAGLSNVVAIGAGGGHSLALKSDGTVVGWGDNFYGQTTIPGGLNDVVAIGAGLNHNVALKGDGTVVAWGDNSSGQTNVPAGLSNVVSIAAGVSHNLALKSNGTVVGWGLDDNGEINVPAGLSNVVAVSAGEFHSLALTSDGTVVAWGYDLSGQTDVPAGLSNVVAIGAGGLYSLALESDGTVVVWGTGSQGQKLVPGGLNNITGSLAVLGDLDLNTVPPSGNQVFPLVFTATNILGGLDETTVNATVAVFLPNRMTTLPVTGATHSLTVLNGTFDPGGLPSTAWFEGGLFPANNVVRTPPVNFAPAGGTLLNISAPISNLTPGVVYHVRLVVTNTYGQIAGGSFNPSLANDVMFTIPDNTLNGPAVVTNSSVAGYADPGAITTIRPVAIAAGYGFGLALQSDGTVSGWGDNSSGQINFVAATIAIAGGQFHSVLLRKGQVVTAQGNNSYGQRKVPGGLNNVEAVAAGQQHSLALRADGTVVAWGSGPATNVPTGLNNFVVAIAAGGLHSLALKNDRTVVAWGDNTYGQINVPSGLNNVVAIAGGEQHSLVLKGDGTVVAWGDNSSGQTNVPAGLSNVVGIAAGGFHNLALKSDGTVAAWGNDGNGQTNVPTGLSNVVSVAAGEYFSVALKSDGTVVAWGNNSLGQTNVPGGLVSAINVVRSVASTGIPNHVQLSYTEANVFDAIITVTRTLVLIPIAPLLTGSTLLPDGTFQLSFNNEPLGTFSVWSSTNVTTPLTNWSLLGTATNVGGGVFQFTDAQATNAQQFYRVTSP